MDIRTMSIKNLEAMKPQLTTDLEKEFYNAVGAFLYEKHRPDCVYHYTDFFALKGILCEKGLRMCRIDAMNDKKEMKNFTELVEKSLKNRFQGDISAIRKIDKKFKDERVARKNDIAYIASFSAWEDDAAQWERYGNNGKGVSIAFDVQILKDTATDRRISLQEVFYGRNADTHQITDVLEDIFSDSDYVRHGFDKGSIDNVFWQIWIISVAHKHFSFMSEQEFRLMTFPQYHGKRYDKLGEICKEMTPTGLRECIYWDWKADCDQYGIAYEKLIKEIVIGPRSSMTIKNLKSWLEENNLECLKKCVRKSKSSLA